MLFAVVCLTIDRASFWTRSTFVITDKTPPKTLALWLKPGTPFMPSRCDRGITGYSGAGRNPDRHIDRHT